MYNLGLCKLTSSASLFHCIRGTAPRLRVFGDLAARPSLSDKIVSTLYVTPYSARAGIMDRLPLHLISDIVRWMRSGDDIRSQTSILRISRVSQDVTYIPGSD